MGSTPASGVEPESGVITEAPDDLLLITGGTRFHLEKMTTAQDPPVDLFWGEYDVFGVVFDLLWFNVSRKSKMSDFFRIDSMLESSIWSSVNCDLKVVS
jgi:hypothetical protein